MARPTKWFTSISNGIVVVSNGQNSINLLSAVEVANRKGSTITRILLKLVAHPEAITVLHALSWGLTFVNSDAASAGAFPDTDVATDNVDWLGRGTLFSFSSSLADQSQDDRFEGDLGASRVWRSEQDQFHLIFDASASGTDTTVRVAARVLLRLP